MPGLDDEAWPAYLHNEARLVPLHQSGTIWHQSETCLGTSLSLGHVRDQAMTRFNGQSDAVWPVMAMYGYVQYGHVRVCTVWPCTGMCSMAMYGFGRYSIPCTGLDGTVWPCTGTVSHATVYPCRTTVVHARSALLGASMAYRGHDRGVPQRQFPILNVNVYLIIK